MSVASSQSGDILEIVQIMFYQEKFRLKKIQHLSLQYFVFLMEVTTTSGFVAVVKQGGP